MTARTTKVESERKLLADKLQAEEEALEVIQSDLDSIQERLKQLGELRGGCLEFGEFTLECMALGMELGGL